MKKKNNDKIKKSRSKRRAPVIWTTCGNVRVIVMISAFLHIIPMCFCRNFLYHVITTSNEGKVKTRMCTIITYT